MENLQRTILYHRHIAHGANMVGFGGYEMPLMYEEGILKEHLVTRKEAGLFDVSHMGRFILSGPKVLNFSNIIYLQYSSIGFSSILSGQ